MKKVSVYLLLFLSICSFQGVAQSASGEQFGSTLNLGIGIGGNSGYSRYAGQSLPVFLINYEFDVARDFTLAPFVSFYTYNNSYNWGDKNNPNRNYNYRELVIPVGLKGTYYFDRLLNASSKWDFYLAGSLGFAIVSRRWDNGYYGDKKYFNNNSGLYLELHVGTEYHFNDRIGMFLDLSTGVSSIGLAIH